MGLVTFVAFPCGLGVFVSSRTKISGVRAEDKNQQLAVLQQKLARRAVLQGKI